MMHAMIDLKTCSGPASDCAGMLSIGAVAFDEYAGP